MKVLLISHMPPPTTGIGSWTRRVLENGIPNYEIGFVNSNMIGGRDPFQNTQINILDEIRRNFKIWSGEAKELRGNKEYKVVHTNISCTLMGMFRETVTGIIAKRYGRKFIVHCHCTVPNVENSRFKKFVFSVFAKIVDGFIVLNSQSEKFVKRYTKRPVQIIPNFVCESELPEKMQREVNAQLKNALFVGGVSPDKGCDTIIQSAGSMPEVDFHLVGIVSEEIKSMTIPKNVKLYGNQSKEFVHQIMEDSDVFIFPSRFFGEGFSVALVEAMSTGLPCIVTDWAANVDMIGHHGEGGIIVPQRNPEVMVETLRTLEDQEIRQKMSDRNVDTVIKNYTAKIVLKQISEFYTTVLDYKNIGR
jgi:glycosyltransferase involved in cell wall biosynthesis